MVTGFEALYYFLICDLASRPYASIPLIYFHPVFETFILFNTMECSDCYNHSLLIENWSWCRKSHCQCPETRFASLYKCMQSPLLLYFENRHYSGLRGHTVKLALLARPEILAVNALSAFQFWVHHGESVRCSCLAIVRHWHLSIHAKLDSRHNGAAR